jgi:hypothetical protein
MQRHLGIRMSCEYKSVLLLVNMPWKLNSRHSSNVGLSDPTATIPVVQIHFMTSTFASTPAHRLEANKAGSPCARATWSAAMRSSYPVRTKRTSPTRDSMLKCANADLRKGRSIAVEEGLERGSRGASPLRLR